MKHDFSELKLDRVTRRFAGAGGKAFNALDELSLTVKRGELWEAGQLYAAVAVAHGAPPPGSFVRMF